MKEPLIHAVLDVAERHLITGMKDLGGGGLSCVVGEMALSAGFGAEVDLSKVHLKEEGMAPWEIWISESQERMMLSVKEEDLQAVPLTVPTLSMAERERSAIENVVDLPRRTPGMVVSTNTLLAQPYIRGIGSEIIGVGGDSSVATHYDGVYMSRPESALVDYFDVERVETLKGPQGTLYGRNATGGTINVAGDLPEQGRSAAFLQLKRLPAAPILKNEM